MKNISEILSPVGGFKQLMAAVENGAKCPCICRENAPVIEVFVHGALCMCYSSPMPAEQEYGGS